MTGHVLVTGTEGTVKGGAYQRALLGRRPDLKVDAVACPLFVALAEEGWTEGPIAEAVARRYLEIELAGPTRTRVDTVVLGCTHFPVLRNVIERVCGPGVNLVDSARTTAEAVALALHERGLLAGARPPHTAAVRYLATDAPERFARVGGVFLGAPIQLADVELVDL
jgi:glutamate racemase